LQNLAHKGGIKAAGVNLRPSTAQTAGPGLSARSQTVPSQDLRMALDELQAGALKQEGGEKPSTLRTIESGKPFLPLPACPIE